MDKERIEQRIEEAIASLIQIRDELRQTLDVQKVAKDCVRINCHSCDNFADLPLTRGGTVSLVGPLKGWTGPPMRCPECVECMSTSAAADFACDAAREDRVFGR